MSLLLFHADSHSWPTLSSSHAPVSSSDKVLPYSQLSRSFSCAHFWPKQCVVDPHGRHVKRGETTSSPTNENFKKKKKGDLVITPDVDSYLAVQHWLLTCRPQPAGWEWPCGCLPAECRETVSDQSGWWISSLQLSVSTGQQTAVPPCSGQVQAQQATEHLHTSAASLPWTRAGQLFHITYNRKYCGGPSQKAELNSAWY